MGMRHNPTSSVWDERPLPDVYRHKAAHLTTGITESETRDSECKDESADFQTAENGPMFIRAREPGKVEA